MRMNNIFFPTITTTYNNNNVNQIINNQLPLPLQRNIICYPYQQGNNIPFNINFYPSPIILSQSSLVFTPQFQRKSNNISTGFQPQITNSIMYATDNNYPKEDKEENDKDENNVKAKYKHQIISNSTSISNRDTNQPKRLKIMRTACDRCTKRKSKCIKSRENEPCQDCKQRGQHCIFSLQKKRGRPRVNFEKAFDEINFDDPNKRQKLR